MMSERMLRARLREWLAEDKSKVVANVTLKRRSMISVFMYHFWTFCIAS